MSDPLSDVLSLLEARSHVSAGLSTGGDWSVRMQPVEGLKFNAVLRGSALLAVDGVEAPVLLAEGDCFILGGGRAFTMASDLSLPVTPAAEVFTGARNGIAQHGDRTDFFVLGGRMTLDEPVAGLLLDALPPVIHLKAGLETAVSLRWLIDRLVQEVVTPRPGSAAAASHLVHLMFVEGLRAWLATAGASAKGWIGALGDRRLGQALSAIHADPVRGWSLPELAATAGMSRASFAQRFREVIGVSPLDYVTRWRMRLAGRELRNGQVSISAIALSHGYQSESAFSNAFKRMHGLSPRAFRLAARQGQGAGAFNQVDRGGISGQEGHG